MGWISRLLEGPSPTFEQDLELLVARWSDSGRKGEEARSLVEIADALLNKAEQLSEESYRKRLEASANKPIKHKHRDIKS